MSGRNNSERGTTHRKYDSGGLGLSAGDFSKLSRSHYPSTFFLVFLI